VGRDFVAKASACLSQKVTLSLQSTLRHQPASFISSATAPRDITSGCASSCQFPTPFRLSAARKERKKLSASCTFLKGEKFMRSINAKPPKKKSIKKQASDPRYKTLKSEI
jgi:hypothetical protein